MRQPKKRFSLHDRFFLLVFMFCILAGSHGISPNLAAAQDLDLFAPEFFTLKSAVVGLGAGLAPEYEGADEFKAYPLPQLRYNMSNGCYVSLFGPAVRANLIPGRTFGFGPMVRYRPERGSVDDEVVSKLRKVDAAVEAGAFGSLMIQNFLVYAAYNKDTSDSYDGYLVDAAAGYRIGIEDNVQLVILALGTYASDEYMNTYFSVDEDNAERSGLPEFQAQAGIKDVGCLVALQYKIDNNWGIMGIMKYTRLLGDAADSPIVDERGDTNNFLDGLTVNYSF